MAFKFDLILVESLSSVFCYREACIRLFNIVARRPAVVFVVFVVSCRMLL